RYLACISLSDNSIGKAILQRWITEFDGVAIDDGWLVLHFWEGDSLHTRGAITLLCGGAIIYSNFAVAIVLFCLTIHYLKSDNMLSISASYRRFQFKILRALFAQSAIPILLVYIPCGLGVTLPLFFNNEKRKSGPMVHVHFRLPCLGCHCDYSTDERLSRWIYCDNISKK
ncbi:hypothetical protein PENTCL1PPCAC_16376, partial [Pristionchus entomophagus]